MIDAADGELARLKKTPSYTGRYLDSVFDIILNFLFLMTICYVSKTSFWLTILAFIGIQLISWVTLQQLLIVGSPSRR